VTAALSVDTRLRQAYSAPVRLGFPADETPASTASRNIFILERPRSGVRGSEQWVRGLDLLPASIRGRVPHQHRVSKSIIGRAYCKRRRLPRRRRNRRLPRLPSTARSPPRRFSSGRSPARSRARLSQIIYLPHRPSTGHSLRRRSYSGKRPRYSRRPPLRRSGRSPRPRFTAHSRRLAFCRRSPLAVSNSQRGAGRRRQCN
jgi:hypothetical protein